MGHWARSLTVALMLAAALPPLVAAARIGGTGTAERRPAEPQIGPEPEVGVFAALCHFSHAAPDDPIVHPGMPGMSHLHDFFGNVTTDDSSTYESLRAGGTTCRLPQDASGYWVPTLLRDAAPVTPLAAKIYYRAARGAAAAAIQPPPPGLRMVAGDSMATAPQPGHVTFWSCRGMIGQALETPPNCPSDAPLDLHVRFPDCWDGVNLDSADHKSHMAYDRQGACPGDHPVPLPKLALIVHYPITGDPGGVSLASGGVYSGHADFFNAWDQPFLAARVENCLQALVRCGQL